MYDDLDVRAAGAAASPQLTHGQPANWGKGLLEIRQHTAYFKLLKALQLND